MADDVIPGAPSAPPTSSDDVPAGPAPVSAESGMPLDRPLQNISAEFTRKIGKVESRLDELISLIASRVGGTPPVSAQPLDQYSDEQLAELYRAGSAEAGVALQTRIATRTVQAQSQQDKKTMRVQQELLVLATKYPQLKDPADPLRQAAMEARTALLNQGYTASPETDLEAIKYAILDNPSLVTHASPAAPSSSVPAPAGIDGSRPRRTPVVPATPPKLSGKALELAKRMGVRDPDKSLERLYKRQEAGRSAVSPLIAAVVREES